jgi:hypothetical protein
MLQRIVFLSLISLTTPLFAYKIITTGAPKSGISMLTDILCSLTNSKRKAQIAGDVLLTDEQMRLLGDRFDILTGTPVCNDHNCALVDQFNAKIIYIVRDPRDQLCSTAHAIYDHKKYIPAAQGKSLDTILLELIEEGSQYYAAQYPFEELYYMHGIADLYALWTPWKERSNVLVVSFEKLAGTDYERMQEIQRIATFLNIPVSPSRLEDITHKRSNGWFGFLKKGPTFGVWKKLFKPNHYASFKRVGQALCKQLGYEL